MKLITLFLLVSCSAALGQADPKESLTKYRELWEESLVTEKPEIVVTEEEELSVLDDYVLAGWTQSSRGYVATLINTKNPRERVTVSSGMPNEFGFQVIDAKRNPKNYKESQVLVQADQKQKWIGYEDKFLTLQQPPAAQRAQNQGGKNQKLNPAQLAAQQAAQKAAQQRAAQQQGQKGGQQNQNRPPIPTNNSNGSSNSQGSSTQRQPRVRRVPVPPKK